MQERFRPGFLIAAYVGVLFIIAAFITVGYPFFFRGSLADPSVEMDLKEGKVWLDTQIVMEFRGSHSKEALLETLEISPKVKIGEDDLKVEHIARFPWHEGFPWAKTRVTINPAKNELFAPETSYTLSIRGKVLNFETITLPKVTRSIAVNCKPQQGPAWWNDGMSTVACFEFIFNEKIVWEDRYFSVSPPTDVQLSTSDYNGKTSVFVGPSERWENSTEYTLTIKKGLKDIFGHELVEDYSNSFTTRPPSKVIEATPEGEGVPIDSVIRVKFDRHGSRNSHDLKFEIHPKVEGALEWEDGLTFVWKPKDNLSYSTGYSVVVGGISWVGDPIPEYRWRFKTEDPPVSVEIQETTHSPRALRAVASGGIGSYSYQWSTGETSDSISVDVPAGETWNISVTVSSGDQSATAEIQVKGPPLPPPIELPIGNGTGIAVGVVDVYSTASNEYDPIGTLGLGQEVKILGVVDGQMWLNWNQSISTFGSFPNWVNKWYEIELASGGHGFVYSAFVFIPRQGEPSPFVACGQKWVGVDRANQQLHAYCDDVDDDIFQAPVGVGLWNATPLGEYSVWTQVFNATMSGEGYHVANVLFTMYFYGSYGIHLDWWHDDSDFGNNPTSHGCVGLQLHNAQWVWFFGFTGMRVRIYE